MSGRSVGGPGLALREQYARAERELGGKVRSMFSGGGRGEKRVLMGGRWVRPDPAAAGVLAWLRAEHPRQAVES